MLLVIKGTIELKIILWITAIIFVIKIISVGILPVGSDDYYRYLWDGKILVNGINPFQYAPDSKSLNHLHSNLLPLEVTYPHIKTIYFPLSQAAFALAFLISGESIWGLKIIVLLSDLLLTLGFFLTLKKRKIDYKYVLLYILSPLIFYQFIIDAHIDLLGIAFFAYTIYFYKEKKLLAALFLGLSLTVKPTFIIAIPIFFFFDKERKNKLMWASLPIFLLVISFIPFTFDANPLDTLFNYSRHWSFNGAAFNLFTSFIDNTFVVRIILIFIFGCIYFSLVRFNNNVISTLYYSMMFLLIFSPVVHPWYAAWLIVLLVIYPKLSGITFISFISLTFYTVMIYQTKGAWNEYPLILLLEYIPVIALLIYEILITNKEGFSGNILRKSMPPENI
jgi:hypothetical protein